VVGSEGDAAAIEGPNAWEMNDTRRLAMPRAAGRCVLAYIQTIWYDFIREGRMRPAAYFPHTRRATAKGEKRMPDKQDTA
jgi:hypothetical protein